LVSAQKSRACEVVSTRFHESARHVEAMLVPRPDRDYHRTPEPRVAEQLHRRSISRATVAAVKQVASVPATIDSGRARPLRRAARGTSCPRPRA
jgi:hypothetical protein